ncbi:hypothetical protein AB0K18_05475 [Nonomuraea sp. NPDC049421]|uniref:hypothetical protein n=1 Tax=Nonomuraea sp. NPDC049421 TaxID=3155275 RepID=UPI0034230496
MGRSDETVAAYQQAADDFRGAASRWSSADDLMALIHRDAARRARNPIKTALTRLRSDRPRSRGNDGPA